MNNTNVKRVKYKTKTFEMKNSRLNFQKIEGNALKNSVFMRFVMKNMINPRKEPILITC